LLLEKPFTMKMLLQKVRQVLDGMEKTAQLLPAGAWQEGTEVHAPLAEHGGREKRLDR
jgi:ABC-type Fe3+ transport system permease subunit